MSIHMEQRLREIEARKTEERIATCMRLVRKNLDMVETDANIKLFALVKLTCLFLVTETMHLPPKQVRTNAFQLFRKGMDELLEKLDAAKKLEEKTNDN